ncbi:hypothetical protein Ancab_019721 [Ancistrocladus abbreviatus]
MGMMTLSGPSWDGTGHGLGKLAEHMRSFKWEKKMTGRAGSSVASSSSSASSNSLIRRSQRRAATAWNCCQGSRLLKQLVWPIRFRWKQHLLKRQLRTTSVHYNYDFPNYCQNFEDARSVHKHQ